MCISCSFISAVFCSTSSPAVIVKAECTSLTDDVVILTKANLLVTRKDHCKKKKSLINPMENCSVCTCNRYFIKKTCCGLMIQVSNDSHLILMSCEIMSFFDSCTKKQFDFLSVRNLLENVALGTYAHIKGYLLDLF